MKPMFLTLLAGLVVFLAAGFSIRQLQNNPIRMKGDTMIITSPAFIEGADIPAKYTCDGDNINPALKFDDIPSQTESLVLIVDDPDSPSGDFVHWLLWNIPANLTTIIEDSYPAEATQGTTGFNAKGYGGPCPSVGKHHYRFTVYALDTKLDLPESATKKELDEKMVGHILSQGTLTGLYQRK